MGICLHWKRKKEMKEEWKKEENGKRKRRKNVDEKFRLDENNLRNRINCSRRLFHSVENLRKPTRQNSKMNNRVRRKGMVQQSKHWELKRLHYNTFKLASKRIDANNIRWLEWRNSWDHHSGHKSKSRVKQCKRRWKMRIIQHKDN